MNRRVLAWLYHLRCLLLLEIFLVSCASLPTGENRRPYGIIPTCGTIEDTFNNSAEYAFHFVNESDLEVTDITISWEGFLGEDSVSGEESFSVTVEPGGSAVCTIVPDFYEVSDGEPCTLVTVRAKRIHYSDGSVWADPFGQFEGEPYESR